MDNSTTMENDPVNKSMSEDLMTSTDFVAVPYENMTQISSSEILKNLDESKTDLLKSTFSTSSKLSNSDDFIHLSKFNKVSFHDVPHMWPNDGDMTCNYSLNGAVLKPGDKIALYKVGWVYLSEYITFERVPVDVDPKERLSVTFKAENFPKDSSELYQLCYLTADNTINGASNAFNFYTPDERELVGVEDPYNPGIVVFKSRIACLQSELRKKVEANESLTIRHELCQSNFVILQKEFIKCEEKIKILTNTNDELSKQNDELQKKYELLIQEKESDEKNQELLSIKEENDKLKAEIDFLKVQLKTEENDEVTNLIKNIDDLTVDKKVLEERLSNVQLFEQEKTKELEKLQEKIDKIIDQDYKLYRYGKLVLGLIEENKSLEMEEDLTKLKTDIEANQINVSFEPDGTNDQLVLKESLQSNSNDQSARIKELEEELKKRPSFQMANTLVELMKEKSELETKLSDSLNDQAAHKSRINVLELEVNALRNQLTTTSTPFTQKMFEQIEIFNQNIPNLTSLNSFMDSSMYFNSLLQKEKEEKIQLQRKIEELLMQDAEMCQKLNDISKTLKKNSGSVPISSYVSAQNKMDKVMKEKHTLEQEFNDLKKEYVGCINVGLAQELLEKIDTLAKHVQEKEVQIQSLEKKLVDKVGHQHNYKKYIFGIIIFYFLLSFLTIFQRKEEIKKEKSFSQLFGF